MGKPPRIGTVRHLPPDDPRNPNHPIHREQWLEMGRVIGRALADKMFDWGLPPIPVENREQMRKAMKWYLDAMRDGKYAGPDSESWPFNLSDYEGQKREPRKEDEPKPRQLPPDDPRNIDHPMHREKWMELARALGRLDARADFKEIMKARREAEEKAMPRETNPAKKRRRRSHLDQDDNE